MSFIVVEWCVGEYGYDSSVTRTYGPYETEVIADQVAKRLSRFGPERTHGGYLLKDHEGYAYDFVK